MSPSIWESTKFLRAVEIESSRWRSPRQAEIGGTAIAWPDCPRGSSFRQRPVHLRPAVGEEAPRRLERLDPAEVALGDDQPLTGAGLRHVLPGWPGDERAAPERDGALAADAVDG